MRPAGPCATVRATVSTASASRSTGENWRTMTPMDGDYPGSVAGKRHHNRPAFLLRMSRATGPNRLALAGVLTGHVLIGFAWLLFFIGAVFFTSSETGWADLVLLFAGFCWLGALPIIGKGWQSGSHWYWGVPVAWVTVFAIAAVVVVGQSVREASSTESGPPRPGHSVPEALPSCPERSAASGRPVARRVPDRLRERPGRRHSDLRHERRRQRSAAADPERNGGHVSRLVARRHQDCLYEAMLVRQRQVRLGMKRSSS